MGGQAAVRGFWVQTLIALLEALEPSNSDWVTVTIEPNDEVEKVDIKFEFTDGKPARLIQVKSTDNQFNQGDINSFFDDIDGVSPEQDIYLHLVGDVSKSVRKLAEQNPRININPRFDKSIYNSMLNSAIERSILNNEHILSHPNLKPFIIHYILASLFENSITGKPLTQSELKNELINIGATIQKSIKEKGLMALVPTPNEATLEEDDFIEAVFYYLGWNSVDKEPHKKDDFLIEYQTQHPNYLKDNTTDHIFIQSSLELSYSKELKKQAKQKLQSVKELIHNALDEDEENGISHCVYFIQSSDPEQLHTNIRFVEDFSVTQTALSKGIIYYLFDNKQFNFLFSVLANARAYRPNLVVKYCYPQTDENVNEDRIGQRNTFLPPSYLNSSVIPIIKESEDRISVRLYCSDSYSIDIIRKLIWFAIKMTNGFANEYTICLPDYETALHRNEVNEVIRSFKNEDLSNRLKIERLDFINPNEKHIIPSLPTQNQKDEDIKSENLEKKGIVLNNKYVRDFLPYGYELQLLLKHNDIPVKDLKEFLSTKNIYSKGDKSELIDIISTLLLSPAEIELLISFVTDKKKELTAALPKNYDSAGTLNGEEIIELLKDIKFSRQKISQEAGVEIREYHVDTSVSGQVSHIFDLQSIKPNEHSIIREQPSQAIFTVSVNDNGDIQTIRSHTDANSRLLISRIERETENELLKAGVINEIQEDLCFDDFDDNMQRVNFFLSFTNYESSPIFTSSIIKSVRYSLDEDLIDESYDDKKNKNFVANYSGNDIEKVKELSDENIKKVILLSRVVIILKFKHKSVESNLNVTLEFVESIEKNNTILILNYTPKVSLNNKQKSKIPKVKEFEKEVIEMFNKLRDEKIQQLKSIQAAPKNESN